MGAHCNPGRLHGSTNCCIHSDGDRAWWSCSCDLFSYALKGARKIGSSSLGSCREVWGTENSKSAKWAWGEVQGYVSDVMLQIAGRAPLGTAVSQREIEYCMQADSGMAIRQTLAWRTMGPSYGRNWKGSGGHDKEYGLDSIHIRTGMWKYGEGDTGHLRSGHTARCCLLSCGDWVMRHA